MKLIVSCLYGNGNGKLSLRYVEMIRQNLPRGLEEFVSLMREAEECIMQTDGWESGSPVGVGYSVLGDGE